MSIQLDQYISKGKDITTRNGCTCKNIYTDNSNKEIRDECTLESDIHPWCYVEEECGRKVMSGEHKNKWFDYCNLARYRSFPPKYFRYGKRIVKLNIIGLLLFITVFVIIVPLLLHIYDKHDLLEIYMPNFDLIATSISFAGGPGNFKIFQNLYNTKSKKILGFISMSIINYLSLIGLGFLVLRRIQKNKSYITGMSIAFIMLLITYLLPNDIITTIQEILSKKIRKWTGKDPNNLNIYYFIIIAISFLIAIFFIFVEKFLINKHDILFDPIFNKIKLLRNLDNKFIH